MSDNPIFIEETEKIKDLVYYMEFKRHEEYDFGSYKRGLLFLRYNKLLDSEDSLVLANDSCYGGVYPFAPVFKKMNNYKNVDFWGLASNNEYRYHLQSYFLVFSPKVLSSYDLDLFLNMVEKQDNSLRVIMKYEVPLTAYLHSLGYTSASYVPDTITIGNSEIESNKTLFPYTMVLKYKFPLIKRKIFSNDSFSRYLKEKPKRVLNLLETINPELHHIIVSEKLKNI